MKRNKRDDFSINALTPSRCSLYANAAHHHPLDFANAEDKRPPSSPVSSLAATFLSPPDNHIEACGRSISGSERASAADDCRDQHPISNQGTGHGRAAAAAQQQGMKRSPVSSLPCCSLRRESAKSTGLSATNIKRALHLSTTTPLRYGPGPLRSPHCCCYSFAATTLQT